MSSYKSDNAKARLIQVTKNSNTQETVTIDLLLTLEIKYVFLGKDKFPSHFNSAQTELMVRILKKKTFLQG